MPRKKANPILGEAIEDHAIPTIDDDTGPDIDQELIKRASSFVAQEWSRASLKASARAMSKDQIQYLVREYYSAQDQRMRSAARLREMRQKALTDTPMSQEMIALKAAMKQTDSIAETRKLKAEFSKAKKRHLATASFGSASYIQWLHDQAEAYEKNLALGLKEVAGLTMPGQWLLSLFGIGPILTSGLIATFDVTKARYAGGFWAYAGLNPNMVWEKGQKRPFSMMARDLYFLATDCFVKISKNPKDTLYGGLFRKYRAHVEAKSKNGGYKHLAEEALAKKNIKDAELRAIYEAGEIPAGRQYYTAKRMVGKIFLSHMWSVMYWDHYKSQPPLPYILQKDPIHSTYIQVPNFDEERGALAI